MDKKAELQIIEKDYWQRIEWLQKYVHAMDAYNEYLCSRSKSMFSKWLRNKIDIENRNISFLNNLKEKESAK